jgi:hypothetical protein
LRIIASSVSHDLRPKRYVMADWNSLEVAKLAISTLTPVLVLALGVVINKSVRAGALRSEIYKTVGGDLNAIYCYLLFVGGWKELTPVDIIDRKRTFDKAMFTYEPFFSKKLLRKYNQFTTEAFDLYSGPGVDARIRSAIETPLGDRRKHGAKGWKASWEERFTKECNRKAQQKAYTQFLKQLKRDLKL